MVGSMNTWRELIAALLTVSCSPTESASQRATMDALESGLVLPDRALPWQEYARYYYLNLDDGVVGLFVHRVDPDSPFDLEHGKRRWVGKGELPIIYGGGCGVLLLLYQLDTKLRMGPVCFGDE